METLTAIMLHLDSYGTAHGWFWYFPLFFFFVFLFMCFMFRGWRRRYNSWGGPGWFGSREYDKADAKDILKERYARGDISKEEYDRIMKDIS